MKVQLISALSISLSCSLGACAHNKSEATTAAQAPAAESSESPAAEPTEARAESGPPPEHKQAQHRRMASADELGVSPDNTGVNKRDRDTDAVVPLDQGNNEIDLDLTQRIRKSVVADDTLSFTAKNVKIISADGHVTLRGPVSSETEKATIGKVAIDAAGAGHVTNQLEVKP